MIVNHMNYTDNNGNCYCKLQNRVRKVAPDYEGCDQCPYLSGSLQGDGVECAWDDVDTPGGMLSVNNPQKEALRVAKLIDKQVVKKG